MIYVELTSLKDILDTTVETFSFGITYETVQCDPNLSASHFSDAFSFRIGDPMQILMFFSFNNNNCRYTTELSSQDGVTPVPSAFVNITPQFFDSIPPNVVNQLGPPWVTVTPTDPSLDGFHNLRLTAIDEENGVSKSFDFEVRLYNNLCLPQFLGIPTAGQFDRNYIIEDQNTEVLFELNGLSNNECTFTVEAYNGEDRAALPSIFNLI